MKRYEKLIGYACLISIVVLSLGGVAVACTADGELDPTFGVGGKVISDFTGEAYAVALQADGKIVVLGKSGDRATGHAPLLVRYQPDGTPDTTFGTSGTGTILLDAASCRALSIQADGKILVAGNIVMSPYRMTTGSTAAAGDSPLHAFLDIVVLRYLPDGTPDVAFGQGGRVTTDLSDRSDDFATGIALQPDGNIVVAGFVDTINNRDFAVVHYEPDGAVDRSFGKDGIVITDLGSRFDEAAAVAVQTDGKMLVAGTTYREATRYDFAVVRYTPEGQLDSTFGPAGTGIVITDITSAEKGHAMALQSDGKIVVAGSAPSNHDFVVVCYNPDGTLDATFGSGGNITTNFVGSAGGSGQTIVLQPDGKLIVGGYIWLSRENRDIALVRYNPDGSLDSTFGVNGTITTDVGGKWDSGDAAALQSDGKIIMVGSAHIGINLYFAVIRYCGQHTLSHIGK